jgi:hypothetical protein
MTALELPGVRRPIMHACRGRLRAGRLGHRSWTCYYGFNDRTFSMPVCQRRALSHLHRAAHRGNSVRCPHVDAAEAKVVRAQRSLGRRATQQDLSNQLQVCPTKPQMIHEACMDTEVGCTQHRRSNQWRSNTPRRGSRADGPRTWSRRQHWM